MNCYGAAQRSNLKAKSNIEFCCRIGFFFGIGIGAWMTKVCSHHTTVHRRRVVFIKSTGAAAMKTWLSSSLGFYASQVHKISRTPATTKNFPPALIKMRLVVQKTLL